MDNSKNFLLIWRNLILRRLIWSKVREISQHGLSFVKGDLKLMYIRKYKDIHQVRWMVSNNHLGLLKSKLEANEFLSFDLDSFKYSILLKVTDEYTFNLLYRRYRDEFKNISDSLIAHAIRYGNKSALRVLLADNQENNNDNQLFHNRINDIKMIDLSIKSGRVEILEFIIEYLKNKQSLIVNGCSTSSSAGSASLIQSHYTERDLLKSCFQSPVLQIKSMVEAVFTSNGTSIASKELTFNLEQYKWQNESDSKNLIKFVDAFNFLSFYQLEFLMKNDIVKFDLAQFTSIVNTFTIFSTDLTTAQILEYLKKFTYVQHYHISSSGKSKGILKAKTENLYKSLDQIQQLIDSTSSGSNDKETEVLLNQVLIIKLKRTKNDQINNQSEIVLPNNESKNWLWPDDGVETNRIYFQNRSHKVRSQNKPDNTSLPTDGSSTTTMATKVLIDELIICNNQFENESTTSIQNRVFNRVLTIYMYNFFYPFINYYQQSKIEITLNKFIMIKKDLNILVEGNLLIEKFKKPKYQLSKVYTLKYIAFKEIMIHSLETGDTTPLELLADVSFNETFKIPEFGVKSKNPLKYLIDYSESFVLPSEFKIFKYCQDNVPMQCKYLDMLVHLHKRSFLTKFSLSSVFCWISNLPNDGIVFEQLGYYKSLLQYNEISILKEFESNSKLSVASKSIVAGNNDLLEYVLNNKDFFGVPGTLFNSAIALGNSKSIETLLKHSIPPDRDSVFRCIKQSDFQCLKLLVPGATIAVTDLTTCIDDYQVDMFRYLVENIHPPADPKDPIPYTYSGLISTTLHSNRVFLEILFENQESFEKGVFGDPELTNYSEFIKQTTIDPTITNKEEVVDNENTITTNRVPWIHVNPTKMDTIKLFRLGKFEEILKYLSENATPTVLNRNIKLLNEAIEFNQMDFLYSVLDIFLIQCPNTTAINNISYEFYDFVVCLAKSNHLEVLRKLMFHYNLKLETLSRSNILSCLELQHNYISKDVIECLYNWYQISNNSQLTLKSSLFDLFNETLVQQRFNLFKFINDTFYNYSASTLPSHIIKFISKSDKNLNFNDYLLTISNDNNSNQSNEMYYEKFKNIGEDIPTTFSRSINNNNKNNNNNNNQSNNGINGSNKSKQSSFILFFKRIFKKKKK